MLQRTAAAAAPAVFGTGHSHKAAGHRELGRLGEVGQDALRRVGQPSLQGRLRLSLKGEHLFNLNPVQLAFFQRNVRRT